MRLTKPAVFLMGLGEAADLRYFIGGRSLFIFHRRGEGGAKGGEKNEGRQGSPQAGWRPTEGGLAPVKGNAADAGFCAVMRSARRLSH